MTVRFLLDGRAVACDPAAAPTLLELLRDHLDATSPKAGCGIGRCGACVVLLDGEPVNACLVPPDRLEGAQVQTQGGLQGAAYEEVAARLHGASAFQCGACSAGIIVTLTWLASRTPRPDTTEAELALSGHLCRCTGYGGLREAIASLFPPHSPTASRDSRSTIRDAGTPW